MEGKTIKGVLGRGGMGVDSALKTIPREALRGSVEIHAAHSTGGPVAILDCSLKDCVVHTP